jgi:hypothetical protein
MEIKFDPYEKDYLMNLTAIISVLSVFIGAPLIVFGFIYLNKRNRHDAEMMRYKRDIMEIELEKEKVHLGLIEAENKKYDRIIEDRS